MFDLGPAVSTAVPEWVEDGPVAVIGDIHGRADLLARLLARLPEDLPVYVVGDLCDRGPDTPGVLDQLLARGARGVQGNHDGWLRDWAAGRGFDRMALHPAMGGRATLASYGVVGDDIAAIEAAHGRVPRAHAAFLDDLPVAAGLTVQGEGYWLIHAGMPSTVDLAGVAWADAVAHVARVQPAALLWARTDPEEMLPLERTVVMGHIPRRAPLDTGSVLALDTGAGTLAGGRLTAVLLPQRRFVTVG